MAKLGNIRLGHNWVNYSVILSFLLSLNCSKVSKADNYLWLSALGIHLPNSSATNDGAIDQQISISSDVRARFQINPEVMENLGFLYTNDPAFPELRKIQDFSIVNLESLIRDPLMAPTDVNLFILDSSKGNIIYTKNSSKIGYFHDATLADYTSILVLPSGKILLISKSGFLNQCFLFTAIGTIVKTPSCIDSSVSAQRFYHYKSDVGKIILKTSSDRLKVFSLNENTTNDLNISPIPNGIVDVSYSSDNKRLSISDKKGSRISVFNENENETFQLRTQTESFSYSHSEGKIYNAPYISSVAINKDGIIYALSNIEDAVYTFDQNLKVVNVYEDTLQFRPFRKMIEPLRIRISSTNEDLYILGKNYVSVARDLEVNPNTDFQWSLPINQDSLKQAITDSLKQSNFDIKKSLFDQPAVKAILDTYRTAQ
ncbi:LIC_11904 family protein [Leptospira borgpetersenii]|uniref:LIC_11904 family protein n=1 Tax=Leptospira borgpetersenii TaxID=174 RepID=UPI000773BA77|nr:hypothetical protein [Leptospira borgpetersenii]